MSVFQSLFVLVFCILNLFSGFQIDTLVEDTQVQNVSIGSQIGGAFVQGIIFKRVPFFVEIVFLDQVIKCSLDQLFLTNEGWKRAGNLIEGSLLVRADEQKITLESVKIKHEKMWTYGISLTRNFVYTVTPYKIIVHNEALVATLAFAFGEGEILFEGFTLGLAALPLLLKAGKKVCARVKSGAKKVYNYIKPKFFDDGVKTQTSGKAELTKHKHQQIQKVNVQKNCQSSGPLQQIDQAQKEAQQAETQSQNKQQKTRVDQKVGKIEIKEDHKNSVDYGNQKLSVSISMQQSLEKFEQTIAPIRQYSEYEYADYRCYTFEQVQAQELLQNSSSFGSPVGNVNFKYLPQLPIIEQNSSYFVLDLRSIGQYFVDQFNDKREFENTCQIMRAQGYEWSEEAGTFVPFAQGASRAERDAWSQQKKDKKSKDPLCCPLTCGCRCQKQVEELEKQITKNGGKRTKFDFEKAKVDEIVKVPLPEDFIEGLNSKKYGKFLFDKINKVWWTKDLAGHGGVHWKIYKKIGKQYQRICEVIKLDGSYVKIINKNTLKARHIIDENQFTVVSSNEIKNTAWVKELQEEIKSSCPCAICRCMKES